MQIRELKNADISAIEKIFDLYWIGEFRKHLSDRVKDFVDQAVSSVEQGFTFFVAEEGGKVLGVAAFRKAPERMKEYTTTSNPAELYVIAVKNKGQGIGGLLRTKIVEETKKLGYTEMVFFSGDTHQDSWGFHDNADFKRAGSSIAPDGESGQIWRMAL